MLTNLLTSRTSARLAVGGLTMALLSLAALALWGTVSNQRATAHVRSLNEITDHWGQVFLNMNIEDDALSRYEHTQDPSTIQPLGGAARQSGPLFDWLEQERSIDQTSTSRSVRNLYETYQGSVERAIAADRSGDVAASDIELAQAALALDSAQKTVATNMGRLRQQTAEYLENVDAQNQRLRIESTIVLGVGLALLALCAVVLLQYQRRTEKQADVALRHLEEMRAASLREDEAREVNAALEIELRHAQKLESVGRLAAGVAHEINTPVQFVGDNLRFLDDSFSDMTQVLSTYRDALYNDSGQSLDERRQAATSAEAAADLEFLASQIPEALAQSIDGIDRVATIVRSMKSFGHPDQKAATSVDLNQAIMDTVVVAGSEIGKIADVEADYGVLPPVMCFASDMNQVWLNLIINACQAMETADRGRGVLGIRTSVDGDRVVVEISDTGTGISETVAERIFDPFFTTKEVGKGTGQGLSLCRSVVVDRHQGTITFDSSNDGTTFHVSLPVDPRAA